MKYVLGADNYVVLAAREGCQLVTTDEPLLYALGPMVSFTAALVMLP
jgi:hypothetical protein